MSPQFPTIVMRAQSDEKLAHLAACGNERAFEAIVDRYRQPLLRYATRIIGDSRADDVVQAAFVSAWSKLHDGEEVRELKAWLYRIVHNGSLNAMKRASSRDLPLLTDNPMSTGDDSHSEVERREDVRRALGEIAALPEQQRHAFLAVAVEGRRHRDVGLELGVSEGAVRMLIHRARSSVRAAAAAFSPFPLIAWLKGAGGAGASAATTGGAASTTAGAGILAGGALKAGALIAATGIVATAGPQAVRAINDSSGKPAAPLSASAPASAMRGVDVSTQAQLRSPRLRASTPAAGGVTSITAAPTAAAKESAPAPAEPASPVPAATEQTVAQHDDAVDLPSHMGHPEFIAPAAVDDDLIFVEEEAPDYAAGERDVPTGGVDDQTAATVNLADDPPAEALIPSAPVDNPSVSAPTVTTPSPTVDPDGEDLDEVDDASANAPAPVTP